MTVNKTMTQKHYLLFGTHGTEQMPKSVVFVALRVSTVLCYDVISLLLFFYDGGGGGGGGGEVLCCRLVCRRSNEATTDARLVFIVDEGLDIHPVVEVGEVVVQVHQSLRSSAYLAALQYRFHFIPLYRRVRTPSAVPVRRRFRPALHRDRRSIGTRADRRDEPRVS